MKKKKSLGRKTLKRVRGGAPGVQFNPKELSVDKSTPWQKNKTSVGDSPTLEFNTGEPKR